VANCDGFEVTRKLEDAYLDAVQDIGDGFFLGVTRFTTSAFSAPSSALESRGVAPHIFESEKREANERRARHPAAP
jgi:propionate CoA-transferase